MIEIKSLPQDFFVPIENSDFLLGRITLNIDRNKFTTEVVLIQKESKKIYKHIFNLYDFEDPQEAIDQSMYKFGQYLKDPQKNDVKRSLI